jgi:hypothetical protein
MLFPISPHWSHKTNYNQTNVYHNFWSVHNFDFKPCRKSVSYILRYFNALKLWVTVRWIMELLQLTLTYHKANGAQISQKSRGHLKVLHATRVTNSRCTEDTQTLGAIIHDVVAQTTWQPGFEHSCSNPETVRYCCIHLIHCVVPPRI